MEYYRRALEQITGKQVKERIIYSFALKKEVVIN
jgi:ATP-dependent helicase/nuclease subunit A